MVKKVLKTVAYSLACAFMFVPVAIVLMLGWYIFFVDASWVSKGFGTAFMIVGSMMIFPPAKVSYYALREVWDPNFKWEFEIPLGG